MLNKILFTTLFLLPLSVFAQQDYPRDISLSWVNADSYVDDTLIEAGDLTGVKIDCYRQNEAVPIFSAIVPAVGEGSPQAETFLASIPRPGTYRCEGFSIVVGDIYSDASTPTFRKYVGKPKTVKEFKFD